MERLLGLLGGGRRESQKENISMYTSVFVCDTKLTLMQAAQVYSEDKCRNKEILASPYKQPF